MSNDPGNPQQPGQGWQGGQQPYPGGYGSQPPQGSGGWGGGPPGPPSSGGGGTGGMSGPADNGRGGLRSLFDFSFNSFATPSLIRIIYIIGTVLIGLAWLGLSLVYGIAAAAGANGGVGVLVGVLALVVGGVIALFYLALLRVSLEFYYAVVRMSEDIHHRR